MNVEWKKGMWWVSGYINVEWENFTFVVWSNDSECTRKLCTQNSGIEKMCTDCFKSLIKQGMLTQENVVDNVFVMKDMT